jgi:DNA-binding HxlR family transcriptional regulator
VRDYGQFCPIARTSELLAERWTPIIIRNLLNGCRTFNEIRQGAPGISTALLAQRLEALERHGVLLRTANLSGRGATYELTEMGLALRPVMDAMGQWGAQWLEIEPRHKDPAYVLWATLKLIDLDQIPAQTTVVRFALRDRPTAGYWLILRRPATGTVHPPRRVRRGHRVPDRLDDADRPPSEETGLPNRRAGRPHQPDRPAATHPPVPQLVPHQPVRRFHPRRARDAGW